MLKLIGGFIGTVLVVMFSVIIFMFGLIVGGLVLKVMWNFFMLGWSIL